MMLSQYKKSKKPKPLLDQIGDELDEAGVQIYSYEQANKVRDQEQQLLTNQINYTNQQIHFFNQCYLPQILDSNEVKPFMWLVDMAEWKGR